MPIARKLRTRPPIVAALAGEMAADGRPARRGRGCRAHGLEDLRGQSVGRFTASRVRDAPTSETGFLGTA
jgi:hypothetical protein